MKPGEWREGMENEAASVEDAAWRRETQLVVLREKRRRILVETLVSLGAALVLAALWMTGLVLVSRFAWHMDANPFGAWATVNPVRFDLSFLGLLVFTGLLLGWRGIRPGRVALALALLPVLLWLIGLSVQIEGVWTEPGTSLATNYTTDFAAFRLDAGRWKFALGAALLGFLSAWAGLTLRRRTTRLRQRPTQPTAVR